MKKALCYLPAKRNCKVENRQHKGPCVFGEKVSDDGWSNSGVTCFTDANQTSWEHKKPEILRKEIKHLSKPPFIFLNSGWTTVKAAQLGKYKHMWMESDNIVCIYFLKPQILFIYLLLGIKGAIYFFVKIYRHERKVAIIPHRTQYDFLRQQDPQFIFSMLNLIASNSALTEGDFGRWLSITNPASGIQGK